MVHEQTTWRVEAVAPGTNQNLSLKESVNQGCSSFRKFFLLALYFWGTALGVSTHGSSHDGAGLSEWIMITLSEHLLNMHSTSKILFIRMFDHVV